LNFRQIAGAAAPRRDAAEPCLAPAPAAILFDLDGTLVDTMGRFADLATDVITRRYGLARRNARGLYLRTSGVPFSQQLEIMFGPHDGNAAAADEYETRKDAVARAATMDGGARAALEELRARGVTLVLSSNGMQAHVEDFADREGGLFTLALGFGGARHKGEPHVAEVCARLGMARADLVFVGDSLRDGELAAASGLRFVARAGTFTRADFARRFPDAPIVDHVAELPALL
jgi:phosphoglycolate phosphatase